MAAPSWMKAFQELTAKTHTEQAMSVPATCSIGFWFLCYFLWFVATLLAISVG